jgi:acetyl esterase/lipase
VPALDLTRDTAQATQVSGVLPDVPQPTMNDAATTYLADPAQARDPLASPLLADDLRDLPPAHVMTAQFDVLRTEGERYAERLRAAGVPATHRRYPGALHGTAMLTRTWDQARQWQHDAATALRDAHWAAELTPA